MSRRNTTRQTELDKVAAEFDDYTERARRSGVDLFDDSLPARAMRMKIIQLLETANELPKN